MSRPVVRTPQCRTDGSSAPRRRARPLAALLLLLVLAATGCGPEERDPNTVTFWTLQLSPTFDAFITGMIADFEAAHPGVTVEWIDVPYEGITQKFLSSIAAGRAPDVVNLPADYVKKYVELGALTPLEPLLPDSVPARYLPAARRPLVIDGHLYALPWYLSTQILIYDRERLRAAGFDPDQPPRTYDELLRMADAYARRTGDYAFFYNLVVDSYLMEVLRSEGIPVVSEDGTRALFDTPEAARVIEEWVETFRDGAMPRESISQGHRAALRLFQSGSIAMFIGGPQYLRIIEENAPSTYASTDVAPAVTGRAGLKNLAVMSLAVAKTSVSADRAAEFAAFVTDAPRQLAFSKIVPIFPSVDHVLDDPYFTRDDSTLTGRARAIAARQIREAEVLKPSLDNYNRLMEAFKAHMLKAFLGDRSVEASLEAAAEDWNQILAE